MSNGKVYFIVEYEPYEGGTPIEVYSKREYAEKVAEEYQAESSWCDYGVIEMEIKNQND